MRAFKLVLGIIELCFLPALLILRWMFDFQAGLIHWIIGGAFFGMGINNIRKAMAPKTDN